MSQIWRPYQFSEKSNSFAYLNQRSYVEVRSIFECTLLIVHFFISSISTLSLEIIEHLQRTVDSRFMDRLRERLYFLSNTIPAEIIARGDVSGCLNQVNI